MPCFLSLLCFSEAKRRATVSQVLLLNWFFCCWSRLPVSRHSRVIMWGTAAVLVVIKGSEKREQRLTTPVSCAMYRRNSLGRYRWYTMTAENPNSVTWETRYFHCLCAGFMWIARAKVAFFLAASWWRALPLAWGWRHESNCYIDFGHRQGKLFDFFSIIYGSQCGFSSLSSGLHRFLLYLSGSEEDPAQTLTVNDIFISPDWIVIYRGYLKRLESK